MIELELYEGLLEIMGAQRGQVGGGSRCLRERIKRGVIRGWGKRTSRSFGTSWRWVCELREGALNLEHGGHSDHLIKLPFQDSFTTTGITIKGYMRAATATHETLSSQLSASCPELNSPANVVLPIKKSTRRIPLDLSCSSLIFWDRLR